MFTSGSLMIRTPDLDRAVEFYTEKFGFMHMRAYGPNTVMLSGWGLSLVLFGANEGPMPVGHRVVGVTLFTEGLAAARTKLEARGVVFEGETVEISELSVAFTYDPDGTPITLIELSDPMRR